MVVARDGSPVAPFAALPAEPELGTVRGHLGRSGSVLDLGCGTGRIADPLALAGYQVVAIDESAEMLAEVRHARPVHSPIGRLDLGVTFDAVLLLSQLINGTDADGLLRAAARHLAPDGVLVVQRLPPGIAWTTGSSSIGPVTVSLDAVHADGARIDGRTSYELAGQTWTQDWVAFERDDNEIAGLLADAGLRLVTAHGAWVTAAR